jgi:hypothetical protein
MANEPSLRVFTKTDTAGEVTFAVDQPADEPSLQAQAVLNRSWVRLRQQYQN